VIVNVVRLLTAAALLCGPCVASAQDQSTNPPAPATAPAQPSAHAPAQPAPKKPAAKPATAKPAPKSATPAAAPAAATDPAAKSGSGTSLLGANKGQGPLEVTSENGIEWQQDVKAYIARGNAIAKRGQTTLYADVLTAYYRDIPNTSQTEIWRVVAEGHVRITTPTQEVVGDHGVYDVDQTVVVMTGQALKLTTPQDVVTARDSMEWYDDKQLAVARGNAVAVRGERRLRGDTLVAQVSQAPGEDSRISRVDGKGHVIVSGPNGQVGTGDTGVYNADTGIATLIGHVTVARGDDTVVGQYGVVDLTNGVSRILPRPPNAEDTTRGRVQGIINPRQKASDAAAPAPAGKAPTGSSNGTPASTSNGNPSGTPGNGAAKSTAPSQKAQP
jgi:lipopolysaccharide export system protein LptA